MISNRKREMIAEGLSCHSHHRCKHVELTLYSNPPIHCFIILPQLDNTLHLLMSQGITLQKGWKYVEMRN